MSIPYDDHLCKFYVFQFKVVGLHTNAQQTDTEKSEFRLIIINVLPYTHSSNISFKILEVKYGIERRSDVTLTSQLNPWNRDLESLTVPHLIEKFLVPDGERILYLLYNKPSLALILRQPTPVHVNISTVLKINFAFTLPH